MNLTIRDNKGFHVTTRDYVFSVQIGAANYCDNYSKKIGYEKKENAIVSSETAEVAVWEKSNSDNWVTHKFFETNGDDVTNRTSIDEVFGVIGEQIKKEKMK